MISATVPSVARRPRGFVSLRGPDAAEYLQRMVSNDVEALAAGESCEALLLTPKARVIAPLRVLRRAADQYLLLTEPQLADTVRTQLLRSRFAAKVAIEVEEHESYVLFGADPPEGATALATTDYGEPAWEVLDEPEPVADRLDESQLELLRIGAGTPRFGLEIDDRVLPAEAGLVEHGVSFTKGCYPGQEPVARLHHRGHANRGLRVLRIDGDDLPAPDAELAWNGKTVGRVTSSANQPEGGVVALGYVRREVPADAELRLGDRAVEQLDAIRPAPS